MPISPVIDVYKRQGVWGGFTLDWYVELFRDRAIMSSLYSTLIIGISSAVIATIIGTLAAMGIHNLSLIHI